MSKKYIPQVNNHNFIYPNNTVAEYDVDIIHDINDNSVSGTVTNFVVTSSSPTGITVTFDWTWSKNSAEVYINPENSEIMLLSVHMVAPPDSYFSPWRVVNYISNPITTNSTYSGSTSFSLTPSQYSPAFTSFINGVYNFEIRMIGHRAVFPICQSYNLTTVPGPSPTPTNTPSSTPLPFPATPTPTATPSATPSNPEYQSGATINVTDVGYIKYTTISGTTFYQVTTLGNVVLNDCLKCSTIQPGFPLADVATFTIVNCGSACTPVPPPDVTPSPTPSTAAPIYYRITDCTTFINYYTQQFPAGTFSSGQRVEGSAGYYYVVSGTYTSPPAGVEQRYVTGTSSFGCA